MPRDRVAVIGGWGLFTDSVAAALASKPGFRVRRFSLEDEDALSEEISAFEPDVVVAVGGADRPIPQAALMHMEEGVAVVTLDPTEPTMSFTYQERNTRATLEHVLGVVRAMLHSRKTSCKERQRKGGAV